MLLKRRGKLVYCKGGCKDLYYTLPYRCVVDFFNASFNGSSFRIIKL